MFSYKLILMAVLSSIVVQVACEDSYERAERHRQAFDNAAHSIIYFQDSRVGVCYARYDRSITMVPCDKVITILVNPAESNQTK